MDRTRNAAATAPSATMTAPMMKIVRSPEAKATRAASAILGLPRAAALTPAEEMTRPIVPAWEPTVLDMDVVMRCWKTAPRC